MEWNVADWLIPAGAAVDGRSHQPAPPPPENYGMFHVTSPPLIAGKQYHNPQQHMGFQVNLNRANGNSNYNISNTMNMNMNMINNNRMIRTNTFNLPVEYPYSASAAMVGMKAVPIPENGFDFRGSSRFHRDSLSLQELENALRDMTIRNDRRNRFSNVQNIINNNYNNNNNVQLSHVVGGRNMRQHQQGLDFSSFSTMEEVRGKVMMVTRDQQSCRFLQQKLEEGKSEDVEMIFSEVKDCVAELMIDQSGNYLVQKLFQVCDPRQMTELLVSLVRDDRQLLAVCLDLHGTRAVQTMLQNLTTPEQRALVVSSLRRITVTLTKSANGHHVIQHCVKFFTHEEKKPILNVIADHCLDIATDKSGCCVLQSCVENADGPSRERLVAEITSNSVVLSEHPYGNYVVQNILGLRIPHVTFEILKRLQGNFVSLAMNKYGSNVVEKCIKESEHNHGLQIIQELINSPNFLMVLQDQYGNYVAQCALFICKGAIRHEMVNLINMHYDYLHSHPYGKRVLAKTRGNKQMRL